MIETVDLEKKIREELTFDEETVLNNKPPDIHIMLNKYIAEKNIPHTEIIRKLNVERSYGYQLINGKRTPTREQIIKIGIMLKLNFKELNQLLKIAGKEILYAKNLTDARVIYSVERGLDYEKACEFIWDEDE